jgi:DNA-binding transcriptional LysR family regulator
MTQQAVSKRVARLESHLGVPLLNRSRAGAGLTEDGAAFLPQARALVSLADQAIAMLRARRRALRIDVLGRDAASIEMVRAFYEASDVDVDIVVSRGAVSQRTALADGSVDAAFGRTTGPLPPEIQRIPACLEPIEILVSRQHPLAGRERVPLRELSGLTAWMPGNARDSEWAEYYRFLSAEFGVQIDTSGPSSAATTSWRESAPHKTSSHSPPRPSSPGTRTSSTSPSPTPRRYTPGPSCGTRRTATRRFRCSSPT